MTMWLDERGDARGVRADDDVVLQEIGDRWDVVRVRNGAQLLLRSFDSEEAGRRFLHQVAARSNGGPR